MLLRELGPDGLRRQLEQQQRSDMLAPAHTDGIAGQVRTGNASMGRKASAAARMKVDARQHRELIEAEICRIYKDEEIRAQILEHASVAKNLQRMVTDRVAVLYTRPPRRSLADVEEDEARRFLAAYKDAKTDTEAETWNRYAFYLGVVHVIPRFEGGAIRWVTITPDHSDVLEDHAGDAAILVYASNSHGAARVAVDAERWWWLSKDWQVIIEEEHELEMRPWVPFRIERPPRSDYWNRGSGQDLLDATLTIGRIYAQMRWTRTNNSKKLTTVHHGQNVAVPENQNLGSNQPVVFEGDGQVDFRVHDTIVPVDQFIAEIGELVETTLENYGLPANAVDFDTNSTRDAANVNLYDALTKLRDRQMTPAGDAELELARRVGALLRRYTEFSVDDKTIREGFRCRYARLTFADTPRDRVTTAIEEMKLGATDPYDFYGEEHPDLTREECMAEVHEHVRARAEFYEFFRSFNMSLDPSDDLKTGAQLNGQLGGRASGVARQQIEENAA
jgi:hypothetical protein